MDQGEAYTRRASFRTVVFMAHPEREFPRVAEMVLKRRCKDLRDLRPRASAGVEVLDRPAL